MPDTFVWRVTSKPSDPTKWCYYYPPFTNEKTEAPKDLKNLLCK